MTRKACVLAIVTIALLALPAWWMTRSEKETGGGLEQPPSATTLGGGPALSWTSSPEVSYDFSLYQSGTVYWTAQVRFRNGGPGGRVSFTVTLEKEGLLVGYRQEEEEVNRGTEYVLCVRGHLNTFPTSEYLTIYCPLKISSPSAEEEVEVEIKLTSRRDYIYLDSVSISPA